MILAVTIISMIANLLKLFSAKMLT